VHAYEASGTAAQGWPKDIVGDFNSAFGFAYIDSRDEAFYGLVASPFTNGLSAIARINADGTVVWQNDYPYAISRYFTPGPARDLYGVINSRFVALDHGSGAEICAAPQAEGLPLLMGGLEGVFAGYRENVIAYDANCGSRTIFTAPPGSNLGPLRYADSTIILSESDFFGTNPSRLSGCLQGRPISLAQRAHHARY
jgi:hypothetical protein